LKKGRGQAVPEIILEYMKNLGQKTRESNEEFLKAAIYSFSHEIGHWKMAQKSVGDLEICPLIVEGGSDFHGCLLKEITASLEGLGVLEELGLLGVVGREWFFKELRDIVFQQCYFCLAEIEGGRCPDAEEICEVLKNFPDAV
jgi:hypothetical protein